MRFGIGKEARSLGPWFRWPRPTPAESRRRRRSPHSAAERRSSLSPSAGLRLDEAALVGLDLSEEGLELEALPPPLGDPDPNPHPLAARRFLRRGAHPLLDGELRRNLEAPDPLGREEAVRDRKSTRLNSSHTVIS